MLMAPTCLENVENVFQPAEKLLLMSPTQQNIDQSEQLLGLCLIFFFQNGCTESVDQGQGEHRKMSLFNKNAHIDRYAS